MRTVSDARNSFNTLIGEAQDGLTTHILKGSEVVAHLVPTNAPIVDDSNLLTSFVRALTAREANAAASDSTRWRDGRLWHAGDALGRLLAWTWRTDRHMFLQTIAHYHTALQEAVGAQFGYGALQRGIDAALHVSLSQAEIAELHQDLIRNYPEDEHA